MVIFMLEEGFVSPIQGSDEIKVCILSKYTEEALIRPKVYTQIKYAKEEYRTIEEKDLNKHSEIKRFVEHYEEVISHIQVTDETKRILKILGLINATDYLEAEGAFLKNKLEFVVDDNDRRDKIMNEINSHTFYVLEANKIAYELFNLPTSRIVTLENANELLNENISRKLKEKINLLEQKNGNIESNDEQNENIKVIKELENKINNVKKFYEDELNKLKDESQKEKDNYSLIIKVKDDEIQRLVKHKEEIKAQENKKYEEIIAKYEQIAKDKDTEIELLKLKNKKLSMINKMIQSKQENAKK